MISEKIEIILWIVFWAHLLKLKMSGRTPSIHARGADFDLDLMFPGGKSRGGYEPSAGELNSIYGDVQKMSNGMFVTPLANFLKIVQQVMYDYHDAPGPFGKRVEDIDSGNAAIITIYDKRENPITNVAVRSLGDLECYLPNQDEPIDPTNYRTQIVKYDQGEMYHAPQNEKIAATFPFVANDKSLKK